jgi:hypothetical protein
MLKIIRRVMSFADWSRSNPTAPPPGDMLDAQFDAIIDTIDHWDGKVRGLIRDDGKVAAGMVGIDAFDSEVARMLDLKLEDSIEKLRFSLSKHAENAVFAEKTAVAAVGEAKQAAAKAEIAKNDAEAAKSTVLAQKASFDAAFSAPKAVQEPVRTDFDDASSEAQAWADSSRLWAEHMPDTLPDNAVKIMDISGDHWSSRWWANQAANAFGMLTSLYLGAHPTPPATNANGGPIQVGSIYYDTTTGQAMIWNGSQWESFYGPQHAAVMTLWYTATANQTAFPLTTPDLNGLNYTINVGTPEGLDVHVNGLRLMPVPPVGGKWTRNDATSTITFSPALNAGDRVAVDILVPPEGLGPGDVFNWALKPLQGQDGVKLIFSLECADNTGPNVTINRNEELLVSVDGVIQQPAMSYTASGDTITFTTAPAADSLVFITWMRSDGGSGLPGVTSDTPDEILAKLILVDGSGSLLDADLLDGQHGAWYRDWANLTGKPATYPPTVPIPWTDVSGKPVTYPPTLPIAESDVTNLVTDLGLKAPLANPVFTGDARAVTPATSDNDTSVATTAYVKANLALLPTALPRSRLVNGAFQHSQENGNTGSGASGYYGADQFYTSVNGTAVLTTQRVQVVTPNGSANRYRVLVSTADAAMAAGDVAVIQTSIEGMRVADFRWGTAQAKQVILRFGWKSPAGTYSICINNGAANRSYPVNFTISAGQANTDTEQVIVIPGDVTGTWVTDNTRGMIIYFTLANGTTYQGAANAWGAGNLTGTAATSNGVATVAATYELFDVGLYIDPQATGRPPPWEMPDEVAELQHCIRYWRRSDDLRAVCPSGGTSVRVIQPIVPSMRAVPAISLPTGSATFHVWSVVNSTVNSITNSYSAANHLDLSMNATAAQTPQYEGSITVGSLYINARM